MAELATHTTLDIITRAAFKYRVITRQAADMLGAELSRLNRLATAEDGVAPVLVNYTRQAFDRKVKRNAIDGALRFWIEQVQGIEGIEDTAAYKLVLAVKAKNDQKMGLVTVTFGDDVYDEDGEWLSEGEITRTVADPPEHGFWNVADDDRETVMIRPREVRQAEQRAILEQRMAEREVERQAEQAQRQAAMAADEDDDSDEDEWDDDEA